MHLSLCFGMTLPCLPKIYKNCILQQKKTHNERVKANQPIAKACYFAYSFQFFYTFLFLFSSKDDYVSRTYFIFFLCFILLFPLCEACSNNNTRLLSGRKESLPLWIQFVFDTFFVSVVSVVLFEVIHIMNITWEPHLRGERVRWRKNCLKLNIRIYMFTLLIYNRYFILFSNSLAFFIIIRASSVSEMERASKKHTLNIKIWRRCFRCLN